MSQPSLHVPELTIAQAADRLGVSDKTVRRWIAAGTLPARRLGAKIIRIRSSDLDTLGSPLRPFED
ncbi:helix-turn-helix domain-containing protein [Rathayibacter festucae]|uniref:Helix-turn-helix domain-containing protein n=1 Tax=Rathayibacter festucae DSM 15932 TaxID=1328866 RepID=A0A3T0T2G7_9MICO|nr:helix-turn-helix domain-containing protein [Rathayibacter festucae]AZZ52814.1 helix-turn-helix domain-containing protein [Rathayibacter festucae DSM 15932]